MKRQCAKCPWRTDVDPNEIPDGYCKTKHEGLSSTIAEPERFTLGPLRMMACHETPIGKERPCIGWLSHQLGPGNNLGLRLAVIHGQVDGDFETVGPQHQRFQDTQR